MSTRLQVKVVDQLAPNSGDAGIQPRLAALNLDTQPRLATLNPGGVRNSSRCESLLLCGSLGSRRSQGTLVSCHSRDQSPVLRSLAIRNSVHGSFSPENSSDNDTECPRSSVYSRTFFSRITGRCSGHSSSQVVERLRNENLGK